MSSWKIQRGCLDALLIDSTVAREAKLRHYSLSFTWIDYKKAYDRVPHDWVLFLLQDIYAPVVVGHIVSNLIRLWQTVFSVGAGKDTVKVTYRQGLFQGDSFSLLLYCLSIAPLSVALRLARSLQQRCHLCFMDNVKVFAKDAKQLGNTLGVVDRVS